MTDFLAQERDNQHIETLPMTVLGPAFSSTSKSETGRKQHDNGFKNDPSQSQQNQEWKESRGSVNMPSGCMVGSVEKLENGCSSWVNKSESRFNQRGRMSLPLNGKYANNLHVKHHSQANGVPSSNKYAISQHQGNGDCSRLRKARSGYQCGCGSSLKELIQNRDPEKPWKSKGDYFVAVLTYLLGIGNVIHFPQLFVKHGGGAFFLPYLIMLIIEGIPLVCLEMAVGQRLGRNSVTESWKDLNPSLRGIGVAAAIVSLMTIFYYNYIVAWCLYYFIHSMRSTLLWSTCPTTTNGNNTVDLECTKSNPAEYYWYRKTLNVADDINKSTGINMFLYLFVLVSWTLSFLLSMRGSRAVSKILITILIFIVTNLVTFFFLGVHLQGWAEGLERLFVPEFQKLAEPVVWMDAAGQIFFSLGIGFGTLTLFSTGNKRKNSCYMDALLCTLGNCGTSVWAGIIMFSLFGFKADYKVRECQTDHNSSFETNCSTSSLPCSKDEVLDNLPPGLSLGFAGLSETFTKMPLPPLWSTLFYFLLFLLGTSSMLGMIEMVLTAVKELIFFKRTWRSDVICGIVCLALCISNLIFVQSTGFYLLEIISGASSIPILLTGLAECIGVAFVYGMDRFSKDLYQMTGKPVKRRWKICWKFISPLIIFCVITGGIVQMIKAMAKGEFTYTAWDRNQAKVKYIPYPAWGYLLYAVFTLVPVICIVYPPLKDYFVRIKSDAEADEMLSESNDSVSCCCVGWSRTYNISPRNSTRINGHVNLTVAVDDG
ncbi:sodium- and chloride-dependent transporter XTRP3-like [Montipora capricornis]|uniref:sodium- and chloride-dependent transporter XTRP3-like n=1 Tax=Montipora capricornis TaxID=246305 RepID=UPI0035F15AB4